MNRPYRIAPIFWLGMTNAQKKPSLTHYHWFLEEFVIYTQIGIIKQNKEIDSA